MKRLSKNCEKGKNFELIALHPGTGKSAIIRATSTLHHAVKHAAYASELGLKTTVRNQKGKLVFSLPPIDKAHRIAPSNTRDRRYFRAVA